MLGKLFGKNKETKSPRKIVSLDDIQVGDMLEFKDRPDLPMQIRGETMKVKGIGHYQYDAEESIEFSLQTPTGDDISLAYTTIDEGDIVLSVKLAENRVLQVFDETEFSRLWDEDFPTITANPQNAKSLSEWVCESYRQTAKEATAYYYNEDRRIKGVSMHEDHDSEELRYHEAVGATDNHALNVEVWGSGETEVYMCRTFSMSIITGYWQGE